MGASSRLLHACAIVCEGPPNEKFDFPVPGDGCVMHQLQSVAAASKYSLWMDSRPSPSWVGEELISRGLAQCNGTVNNSSAPDALPPSLIWTCCKNKDLLRGTSIHHELQKRGFIEKKYSDALVTMYAKCGELQKAQALLHMHNNSNIIPWTALISAYARDGKGRKALDCFEQMQRKGIVPNDVTYRCVLKACASIGAIEKGKKIHDEILRQGLLEQVGGALVDMYAKCGALHQARSVLEELPCRTVVAWSALIGGYAQNGQGHQALDCFKQMQSEGILPSEATYVCILKACAAIKALDEGKKIHEEILRQGLLEHHIVLGGALVDMYVKCGALCKAQCVLEKLRSRNVISWSALIAGYAQNGQDQRALDCFEKMQHEGILPDAATWNALITGYVQNGQGQQALDCFEQMKHMGILPTEVTYVCILKACAGIGAIEKGKEIHDEILRQGLLKHHIGLGGALVDMFAKCGALHQAQSVLEKLPSRDVVSWSALIGGYAQNGQGQQAMDCFKQMLQEGIFPDEVTFCCLLNLCSHLGLVEKGQELFDNMESSYGLKPNVTTFTCMIDLLGRAGHLVKAVDVIQGMPFSANSDIWHCLLAACRKWRDVSVGTWAFEQAVELDKCDGAAYILMVNIYAAVGMPEKAKEIEAMRVRNRAWMLPGCSSWTDPNSMVHEFC